MKRVAAVVALICVACAPPPEVVSLVIDDATVIDPLSGQLSANHSVFILDDTIVAVRSSGRRSGFIAPDTVVATGRFLIPGLIDAHVHLFRNREVADHTLDLLLANGVTSVREMASGCWGPARGDALCSSELRAINGQVESGERLAPRLLALSSPAVNGVSQRGQLPEEAPAFGAPETGADGIELARWLAGEVDLVKVYNSVPREAYFGLLAEASELGLEVSGHLPLGVSLVEASAAGHRTIEHARDLPVACSSYSAEYRRTMARVVDGEEGVEAPGAVERIRSVLEGFDEALCRDVLATLAANGTYLVPTHGTREMDYRAGETAYREDERMKYVLAPIRGGWDADLDRTARATPELVELYREFYDLGVRLSAMAHAAGVSVMAGTDANDTMIIPGFALHDELRRFAQAGMSPMDVLRTATTVPAAYLGRGDELGTVSPGRLADLVLLDADPLRDVGNTGSIHAVILGGTVLDRSALDEMLRRAEVTAAGDRSQR